MRGRLSEPFIVYILIEIKISQWFSLYFRLHWLACNEALYIAFGHKKSHKKINRPFFVIISILYSTERINFIGSSIHQPSMKTLIVTYGCVYFLASPALPQPMSCVFFHLGQLLYGKTRLQQWPYMRHYDGILRNFNMLYFMWDSCMRFDSSSSSSHIKMLFARSASIAISK